VRLPDLHASWQWIVGIGGVGLTVIYWGRIVAFIKSILELDEARLKRANAKFQLRNTQLQIAALEGDGIEHKLADDKKAIRIEVLKHLLVYPTCKVTDLCEQTGATLELQVEMHAAEELYLSNGWCMRDRRKTSR